MLCSKCLVEMRRGKSGHVCPKCGQTGTVLLEDGNEAEFEPPREQSGPSGWIAAVVLLIGAGLAGAGWYWRGEIAGFLPASTPPKASRLSEAPGWRPARLEEFPENLRDSVIAVFGTEVEDRVEAFAVLPNGEIAVLLSGGDGEGAPSLSLVRMSGRAELAVERIEPGGRLVGASLAPAGLDGVYLALTTEDLVRLTAFGAGPSPLWERRLERARTVAAPALVVEGGGIAYLLSPSESAGRISVAAYDRSGGLLWQRSFDAAEGGRLFAHALPDGGLFAAFETGFSETASDSTLVFLSDAGETRRQAAGVPLAGRLAGARAGSHGAELLVSGETVDLVRLSVEGEITSISPVPGALLNEAAFLKGGADRSGTVISAYRLSDIQTDMNLSAVSEHGLSSSERYRLPAGSRIAGVEELGAGALMIAGSLGEGQAADAFLLVVGGQPRAEEIAGPDPILETTPPAAEPPPAGPVETLTPPGSPASAEAGPATSSETESGPVTCRFSCREGDTVFTLTRTLASEDAESLDSLDGFHAAACRQLAAERDESPPQCGP